jgi:hypothetical protein
LIKKGKLLEEGISARKNVTAIANRVVNALAFGMKHPDEKHLITLLLTM